MLVEAGDPCELGAASGGRLGFTEPMRDSPEGQRFNARRLLLDDRAAFDLSFWCGTSSFLFERMSGANQTLSLDDVQAQPRTPVLTRSPPEC